MLTGHANLPTNQFDCDLSVQVTKTNSQTTELTVKPYSCKWVCGNERRKWKEDDEEQGRHRKRARSGKGERKEGKPDGKEWDGKREERWEWEERERKRLERGARE